MPLDERLEGLRDTASWALERWAGFPATSVPRPPVFVGSTIRPEGGFHTARGKLAFLDGQVETSVSLPDDVLAVLREGGASRRGPPGPHTVVINGASRLSAEFATDRGRLPFPAWRLTSDDLLGYLWVLDPEIAATQWTPKDLAERPPPQRRGFRRGVGAWLQDDATLHFSFIDGAPEHIDFPSAEVFESDSAVAVVPVGHDIGPPGPRLLLGHRRQVCVPLRQRFAGRILLNLDATPIEVVRRP